jgi:hypothetical protein
MIAIFLKVLLLFAVIIGIGLLLAFGVIYLAWAMSRQDNGW